MPTVPMICGTCKNRFVGDLDLGEIRCTICDNFAVFDNESYVPPTKQKYGDHHINSPLLAPIDWLIHHRPHIHRKHHGDT